MKFRSAILIAGAAIAVAAITVACSAEPRAIAAGQSLTTATVTVSQTHTEPPVTVSAPPVTVTSTVHVTQASTPDSCLVAIDLARETFDGLATILDTFVTVLTAMPDALNAAAMGDADGINAFSGVITAGTDTITEVNEQLDPDAFNAAAAACEAGE